jgi:hypothetical protein
MNNHYMAQAKLQAMLDIFQFYGENILYATQEWSNLTCNEQMIVESYIQEA